LDLLITLTWTINDKGEVDEFFCLDELEADDVASVIEDFVIRFALFRDNQCTDNEFFMFVCQKTLECNVNGDETSESYTPATDCLSGTLAALEMKIALEPQSHRRCRLTSAFRTPQLPTSQLRTLMRFNS